MPSLCVACITTAMQQRQCLAGKNCTREAEKLAYNNSLHVCFNSMESFLGVIVLRLPM